MPAMHRKRRITQASDSREPECSPHGSPLPLAHWAHSRNPDPTLPSMAIPRWKRRRQQELNPGPPKIRPQGFPLPPSLLTGRELAVLTPPHLHLKLRSAIGDQVVPEPASVHAWSQALRAPLQAVITAGVGRRTAFRTCHRALRIIHASWRELSARAPAAKTDLVSCTFELRLPWCTRKIMRFDQGPVPVYGYAWRMLLRAWADAEWVDGAIVGAIAEAVNAGVMLVNTQVEDREEHDGVLDPALEELTYVPKIRTGSGPCSSKLDQLVVNRDIWEDKALQGLGEKVDDKDGRPDALMRELQKWRME